MCLRLSGCFRESPKNNTTGLNSVATFECSFCGSTAIGIVNGSDNANISEKGDTTTEGTYDLTIQIFASEATNNSEIWCRGYNPNVDSSHAWLTVQGEALISFCI